MPTICDRDHPAARRLLIAFVATSALIKLALLLVDAQPRFFLGDSGSYLATAIGGHIPRDRSWLYGLLAVAVTRATRSLMTLVMLQTIAGIFVSATVGAFATLRCGVPRALAWVLVVLTSVDPLALWGERSVLTESFGVASFWAGTLLLVAVAERPILSIALLLAASTLLAVAFRTAFAPHALVTVALCAWLAWRTSARAPLAAGLLILLGLRGYATLSGALVDAPPALNPRSGAFLIGLFAPIVRPVDFDGLGVRDPAALLRTARSGDFWRRNAQTFDDDGIFTLLEQETGHWQTANRIAGVAARRAFFRNPAGTLAIARVTALEYLDPRRYREQFPTHTGLVRPLDEPLVRNLSRLVGAPFDAAAPLTPSLCSRWFERCLWLGPYVYAGAWMLPLLVGTVTLGKRKVAGPLRTVGVVSLGYVAAITVFSLEMTPRFLAPLVPCVAVLTAAASAELVRVAGANRRLRGAAAAVEP